ncbi:uncharacterized protein B0J16DRAFT_408146 [Fusarium flagelliforme]|uniref:uncharacterized protein n=1 Tax=Fusarium flagelliforme TaxID=2675880 RepID=UPI001E8E6A15|nr:uncharacterized protein B0J16DRAFT_408146 [Fusarium flagelliforme]KAH7196413.1 hypothetical protein B0J16DRAFT_408146 [Fusarium flagelliforme]
MAGVPTAKGCDACLRSNKTSMFALYKAQNTIKNPNTTAVTRTNTAPAAALSNERTLITGNLVHILNLNDPAYEISTYGSFVVDLPRHVGSSKALDAAISAFVEGFGTMRNKTAPKVKALDRYVDALGTLREAISEPKQANSLDNMCAIYLIAICQEWLGNCYDNAKHYQVLGNLLENAVQNPSFDPSARPFMHTIFAVVVLESFTNPKVQLGPWFWQAFSLLSEGSRPLKSGDGTSFASLDIGTMGEMSCFIRDPDKYLYQIRCTYALIQMEQPRLIEAVGAAVAKARKSGSTAQERRLGIRFHTANAAMLTMASILNRIIRSYDDDPVLLEEAKGYVDDIIVLGQDASSNRPIAASAVATPLVVALAVLEDYSSLRV